MLKVIEGQVVAYYTCFIKNTHIKHVKTLHTA